MFFSPRMAFRVLHPLIEIFETKWTSEASCILGFGLLQKAIKNQRGGTMGCFTLHEEIPKMNTEGCFSRSVTGLDRLYHYFPLLPC
jgi:hypothetical protein